jgi:hypothetical protein
VSVGHQEYYRRVFARLGMTMNPTMNAMFGRLDRNDASNKKRKRYFDYKLKRSMTANKVWRNNLTTVRMDRAAGRGYGEKAAVVKKSEMGSSDKKVISKSSGRTPRILMHIYFPVLQCQYKCTYRGSIGISQSRTNPE